MEHVQRYIEHLYDTRISRDYDQVIPIVGDEGDGKSTFALEWIARYEDYRGNPTDAASLLDYVVFDDRDAFKDALLAADEGDPIVLMDAAHVLHVRDTMSPEQKETEKTLLDIRLQNHPILLGYQDWGDIPDQLRRRRARSCFYIRKRGLVEGYSRASMDEKYDDHESKWPNPDLIDTFPDLSGTEIWRRFQEMDEERKRARLEDRQKDGDDESGMEPRDVLNDILSDDATEYVDENPTNGRRYLSKPLIKLDYPSLSDREADQVKAGLRRESDVLEGEDAEGAADTKGGDPPTHTQTEGGKS